MLLAVATVLLSGCSAATPPTAGQPEPDPGIVHVHGLDVGPEDGSLYVATHTGLFRAAPGQEAERVGGYWHDLMGFTIVGPGDFIASGHPDMRDENLQRSGAPPLLGLVASPDQGASWESVSLLGEVDLHALESVHGRVYGADSTSGRFMISEDRTTWETRSQPALFDFAVNPGKPEVIIGIGDGGTVRSDDGGRTWKPAASPPLAAVAWDEQGLVGIAPDGTVLTAASGDGAWQPVGSVGGQPEALHVEGAAAYTYVAGRGVLQSDDRGATWTVRLGP